MPARIPTIALGMHPCRVALLLAVCTPAAGFTMGSVARHAVAPRASARMDEESRKRAEDALERAQQRAKDYAREKRTKGPEINPNTYNVLYSAIIGLTLNDLRQNDAVTGWLAAGARLDEAPLQQLGASTVLMAYALFQLLFSIGGAGTSAPFRFAVNRLGVTEPPFSSALNDEKRAGDYVCASCQVKLFDSSAKFDSGSGWPAFWRTHDGQILYKKELDGRMEAKCSVCDAHLGHVFSDGPDVRPEDTVPDSDPGGSASSFALNDATVHPRFCINGCALEFRERQGGATTPRPPVTTPTE